MSSSLIPPSTSNTNINPSTSNSNNNSGRPRRRPRDPPPDGGVDGSSEQGGRPRGGNNNQQRRRRQPRDDSQSTNADGGERRRPVGDGERKRTPRPPREPRPKVERDAPPHEGASGASKPPSRAQNKRGGRFNGGLSSEPGGTEKGKERELPVNRYAQPPRDDDDLATRLTRALSTAPYPDCPICFASIHPAQPTWSCSPPHVPAAFTSIDGGDANAVQETAQCCWTTFHMKCIRNWAETSVKNVKQAWAARGEEKEGDWRCPGCQSKRTVVPRVYTCLCGSTQDPKPPRLSTPHSCAAPCSRRRACGHECPLVCHPGPCPPCAITTQTPCHCGKQKISFVCSRSRPSKNAATPAVDLSCGAKCNRILGCGNHTCQDTCHPGPCSPCVITEPARCYCGKSETELRCGQADDNECSVDGEESWVGKYACDQPCTRKFACGEHTCTKSCHPPSSTPPPCPRSPERISTCPCGKHVLADAASAPFFPPGTKLLRASCLDKIPTCASLCMRPLPCGHACSTKCHEGDCPPCRVPLVRPCRCGSTTRQIPCHTSQTGLGSQEEPFTCDRPCHALRACGRHQCNRPCCPLAALAVGPKGKGKKKAAPQQEIMDPEGWHVCDLVCGKSLACGNHDCEERDHKGACPSCLRSSFEEMVCHCGLTVLEPPIPCGTRINCTYPCSRGNPPCGHPRIPHACHEDPAPCPPCVVLTSKPCACTKQNVPNVRCSQEKVSCGQVCGKLMSCGGHRCDKVCHSGPCGACTATCGKPRSLCLPALHPCTIPCHAPSSCPESEPCTAPIEITCPCGRIRQAVQCARSTTSPTGRATSQATALKCSDECAREKRKAKLAEAFGVVPGVGGGSVQVASYSDELREFARSTTHGKFVGVVEKAFSDFLTSDKKAQTLPHMPEPRRRFVYALAAVYRMDAQMVDAEPHRSVQIIRRIDSRIPTPLLSSVASQSQRQSTTAAWGAKPSPAPAPAPASAAGAGRGWRSVVAQPGSVIKPALAPAAPVASTSRLVPLRPSTSRTAVSTPRASAPASGSATPARDVGGDVPENWEDEA
ncbi:hypothetical protein PENSPDRAFT_731024 [Peniophora sp. CONT]|nr:hypothetical protein PENSPDRAFT_731024 [Peniophora sp. CONT]